MIPQHTGIVDHSNGVLLCIRCHQHEHIRQRNAHKVVDSKGYSISDRNPYRNKARTIKQRRAVAEATMDAWSSSS